MYIMQLISKKKKKEKILRTESEANKLKLWVLVRSQDLISFEIASKQRVGANSIEAMQIKASSGLYTSNNSK